ncbi:hypothetical protein GQ600_27814 [Phytophthora cactorum]|nr:hypothetical protein GQ600_27814 [Phytophthora cactorum]
MDGAAAMGYLDMLKWFTTWWERLARLMLWLGLRECRHDVVEWLHRKRSEGCTEAAMDAAAGRADACFRSSH